MIAGLAALPTHQLIGRVMSVVATLEASTLHSMEEFSHITIIAQQISLITTVVTRIVLLAMMTVALALHSTDHLTIILIIIKTALLIQAGCGLHIILHQMLLILA